MEASAPPQDLSGLMSRLMLREELSASEIHELESIVQQLHFPAGSIILTEGALNDRLYCLLQGEVAVLRGGEKIATLSIPGDLLGEMSLITKKPCSASSIAGTDVVLLTIDSGRISGLSERLRDLLSTALDRMFSVILVEKLNSTNEKARLFEITNRELERAKKALETASRSRIDELSSSQQYLLERLGSILSKEAQAIRDELSRSSKRTEHSPKLSQRVHHFLEELEDLQKNFQSERRLNDIKVLLAEDNVDEQINAKMSLGGSGVDLTVVSDLKEAREALSSARFDIVCVNHVFAELLPFARSLYPDSKLVFVTSEPISQHFETLRQNPYLASILARHPDDRTFTVRNTATTIRKLTNGDVFGLEKYLGWGTEIREHRVQRSDQRAELIEKMTDYFSRMGIRGVLIRRCERVAEELLMNVIYDAPRDDTGKPLYNHLDRQFPVALSPEHQGTFRYACDGSFLAVSTEDPFGGLSRSTVLNYLERCFGGAIADQTPESGGGGNGLFQIIQSSSLVVFNVRPKLKTEVIALFNINIQINKISVHPSFHFFEAD